MALKPVFIFINLYIHHIRIQNKIPIIATHNGGDHGLSCNDEEAIFLFVSVCIFFGWRLLCRLCFDLVYFYVLFIHFFCFEALFIFFEMSMVPSRRV